MRSIRTGDQALRLVYLELLFALHEAGGAVRDDCDALEDELGIPRDVIASAVDKLVEMGKLLRHDGALSNPRVSEDLERAHEFSEKQSTRADKRWSMRSNATVMPPQCRTDASASNKDATAMPAVAVAVTNAVAVRTDGRPSAQSAPRANPFVDADRSKWEREALALTKAISSLTGEDGAEIFARAAHYEGALRQKVNPAGMSSDRLANTVLDLRATLRTEQGKRDRGLVPVKAGA